MRDLGASRADLTPFDGDLQRTFGAELLKITGEEGMAAARTAPS